LVVQTQKNQIAQLASEESQARAQAEHNERRAVASEQKADQLFHEARQAVDDFLLSVAESEELTRTAGTHKLRRRLLQQASAYYEGFLDRAADDDRVGETAGRT